MATIRDFNLGYAYPWRLDWINWEEFTKSHQYRLLGMRNDNMGDDHWWWLFENELKMNDSKYKKLGEYYEN